MKLIIGLGNPGKEYENTRHNVGFIVVDNFINGTWKEKFKALYLEDSINGEKVIFIKPQTYMNLSGQAVVEFINYYKVNLNDILVIHDDLDLPSKKIRIKKDSSSGGHNGINDIINKLGTKDFLRLKIGIGNNKNVNTRNYVLDKMTKEEIDFLKSDLIKNVINDFINNADVFTLSNKYN